MGDRASQRRRAREHALRFLYGLEFTGYDWEDTLLDFWEVIPEDGEDTVGVDSTVKKYAEFLMEGVCTNQEELDASIGEALENWTPDRIGRIERSILRIAAFEMVHAEDVPPTVAINEAIEVAKAYGGDETPRFVNGVLDRLRAKLASAE